MEQPNELIPSMLDQVQHLMNTTYVFPEDKIELLKWDDFGDHCIFPEGYPKNEGSYLTVLTNTIQQVFQDAYVHHAGMLHTSCLDRNFMTAIHLTTVTDIENTYELHVETRVYKPHIRIPVVVSCQLTCTSCTKNTTEDYRAFLQYLLNQKKLTEESITASQAKLQSEIYKFQTWMSNLVDISEDLTTTIRLIQREVPNLPEQMRLYNKRLSHCSGTLNEIVQHLQQDVPSKSGIADCVKID